jgi:plastocyanin
MSQDREVLAAPECGWIQQVRWELRWILLLLALALPQMTPAQWKATVGAQSKDLGRQALAFLPNEIWIHEGESITWTFETDEIHTVSFLQAGQVRPPFQAGCPGVVVNNASFDGSSCVTTPPLVKGETFTVEFPLRGNYKLVCLVHENMTGVVHVLEPAATLPLQQEDYDDIAAQQKKRLLADVEKDQKETSAHHHTAKHVTSGTGEIVATAGGSQTLSVLRFLNDTLVIHAGETAEWTNEDPITPHTITFGTEPANPVPPSANVTTDADGARHATISSVFDIVHSGFIVAAPQDRIGLPQADNGVTRFRVTFTKAGAYPFICALHDDLGMKGKVIVLP